MTATDLGSARDAEPGARARTHIPFIGGFESTFMPAHDVDVAELTHHIARREEDLDLMLACGVERLRYPIRWHRVEEVPGKYDWSETDQVMQMLRRRSMRPIIDLVHHTSYPRWLTHGFADSRFGPAFLRYVEAFVRRYPYVRQYTLLNEPFSTLFLCGHEGVWPPHHRGIGSFIDILLNVLPAVSAADELCRALLPGAEHVWVDSCERHGGEGRGSTYAAYANDRRFFILDALLGTLGDVGSRPFVQDVLANGGDALLSLPRLDVDVLGLDYYAHCQWFFTEDGGVAPTPFPPPLAELIAEYHSRYERPCMLTETNLRGFDSDRATWLKYVLEQCETAAADGIPVVGLCWFPFVDSCDWDSLLQRSDGRLDPVGVFIIDADGRRRPSRMSHAYQRAASGSVAADLPAYELREPVASWLEGYRQQMSHWTWRAASDEARHANTNNDRNFHPLRGRAD